MSRKLTRIEILCLEALEKVRDDGPIWYPGIILSDYQDIARRIGVSKRTAFAALIRLAARGYCLETNHRFALHGNGLNAKVDPGEPTEFPF